VGASGVGKTTLAEYVEDRYGFVRLASSARTVMERWGISIDKFDEVMSSPQRYAEFQHMVALFQIELERYQTCSYVSDRAFDHLAYVAIYGTNARQIYEMPEMKEYLAKLAEGKSLIFHVRPTRECQHHAKMQRKREQFLDWEDMHKVDGVIRFIAEAHGIPTIPISCVSINERRWLVDGHLKTHGILPKIKEQSGEEVARS